MMEERDRGDGPKEQFAKLRPVCVALMQERTVEALKGVQDAMSMLGVLHPHLLEYVLLPLRTTLHRSDWYACSLAVIVGWRTSGWVPP